MILNISSEIVCFIISKAQEFQAQEGVSFPEDISSGIQYEYDSLQILANHRDDLTFQEAKKVIEDLEPDQQIDILALLYVGRGDFNVDEWDIAREEAKNNLAPLLTEYLFSKPYLPNYLREGLKLLGYTCAD